MNQWDVHAGLYDEHMGDGGDALHTKVIDPLIVSYLGNVSGKTVVDLGCGNGYAFHLLQGIASYTGVYSSPKLLENAKRRVPAGTFVEADITKPLDLPPADIILCTMVLQYVPVLDGVVDNVAQLLKPAGICSVIVDHPSHALFARAQQLADRKNEKFLDLTSYFEEGKRMKLSLWGKATLSYYHRTVASYVNAFAKKLRLDRMDEVSENGEVPRILGFTCIKEEHATAR